MRKLPRYTITSIQLDPTAATLGPRNESPVALDHEGLWVAAHEAEARITELEAERDDLNARLARARDVVKLLNAELSAPVSATYAIRWNHVAAIMSDLTAALDGGEEQGEG